MTHKDVDRPINKQKANKHNGFSDIQLRELAAEKQAKIDAFCFHKNEKKINWTKL